MFWQVTPAQETAAGEEEGYPEVIEFPWVVIDVANKSIVESKVVYVKPECCAELGDRCKALSGLDEATLASGSTLQACVKEFNDYLFKQFTSENKDFCFVTDGDSSLKRWLRTDAKRKKVKLAAHYSKFIDVRAEFRQKYSKWAGVDACPAMADRLGIQLEPTVDGGLRMCSTLAAIVVRMLEEDAQLAKTVAIADEYDPLVDPLYVKGGAKHQEPSRAKVVQGEGMPESTIVKCRGMPYSAQTSDVEEFFAGCKIAADGIWIVQNQFARASGEAYITFDTALDALRATRRSRDLMSQRYVEVFASTQSERDSTRASMAAGASISGIGGAVAPTYTSEAADDLAYGGVAKMRGLPYTTSYDDIKRFFEGLPIKADGITLCENREGRNSGEAYVEFQDEASAFEAVKRDRQNIGARYVEVYKVTKADLANYLKNRLHMTSGGIMGMGAAGAVAGSGSEFFIKVRGLPFTAREVDIVAFFGKASVVPSGVSLVYNARDQPNGECYVELRTADELSRALTLHRDSIGHRYVELFRTTRIEAMQALGMQQANAAAAAVAAAQAYMPMQVIACSCRRVFSRSLSPCLSISLCACLISSCVCLPVHLH